MIRTIAVLTVIAGPAIAEIADPGEAAALWGMALELEEVCPDRWIAPAGNDAADREIAFEAMMAARELIPAARATSRARIEDLGCDAARREVADRFALAPDEFWQPAQ